MLPALTTRAVAPDLTVEMIYGLDPRHPRRARVTVKAGALPVQTAEWDEPEGAAEWIQDQFARLASLGSRGPDAEVDSARVLATAEGVGEALWRRYAPPVVQEWFWTLADEAASGGAPFEAIQIVTNDAVLPWEVMRPSRDGVSLDFLGAAFDIGRWHVDEAAPRRAARPVQRVDVRGITVLAPEYDGRNALPAQGRERTALLRRPGAQEATGTFDGLQTLLRQPPPHILHFSGHGQVRPLAGGTYDQVVLLEDGDVDLIEWQGLMTRATDAPPFVFFNACEVGQTARAAGFVTGWAATMLDAGVTGYVGALWPIGDAAAADFAEAFYDHLFEPTAERGLVASALRRARRDLYHASLDPSHLAYVYYGDPLQRLILPN